MAVDISDYADFFSPDTILTLNSLFYSSPRLTDLAWPTDAAKADAINEKLTNTMIEGPTGTIKRQNPMTSLALLDPADRAALIPHVACNLYDKDLHMLQHVLNILPHVKTLVESKDFSDALDILKNVCYDGYDFLVAGFAPDLLDQILYDLVPKDNSIVELWTILIQS